ncbi:hypothetical protein CFC21_030721 [Triticum aestivum]|uniref:Uncharacterized protein n=3 Tax=Triticinae TaxID=1648030 RepID=A0A453CDJ5_AEGTS|nr:hypothetical protein CFC21_030721 [Triticum aestivum]
MSLNLICRRERRKERREKGRGKRKGRCGDGWVRVTGRSAAGSSPFTPRWSKYVSVQPSCSQGPCEKWKVEVVRQPEQQEQGSGVICLPVAQHHCISFLLLLAASASQLHAATASPSCFIFRFYMFSYRLA